MSFSREHSQWINETVGSILFQVGHNADAKGHFQVFNRGNDDLSQIPVDVIDEAVERLQAAGVNASRDELMINVKPPFRKPPGNS